MREILWKTSTLGLGTLLALILQCDFCFAQNSTAQAVPPAPASYRVAGRIVSATDGRPLRRASVQIFNVTPRNLIASTIAGEEGEFAFAKVGAGAYSLQGKAAGYITADYEQHGDFSTAIIFGVGVDTESLLLKLTPEADLSGRVTDEAGDAVRHANIALYRESRETGVLRITRLRFAQTDDLGWYDFAQLAPGRYFLSAIATPWYAVHPQSARQAGTRDAVDGVVDSIDPSLDVAYATTFYPGATDSSGAAAIALRGGEQIEANIRLSAQPAVTITIPRAPEDKTVSYPQLQKFAFNDFEQVNGETRISPTEYSMVGLPPGQYVLKQTSDHPGGIAKESTLNITGRTVALDPGSGKELATIKVLLKGVDGEKLPPQTNFALVPEDQRSTNAQVVNEKGEAELKEVRPGKYTFVVYADNLQYFVVRVLSEGKALPGNTVRVAEGATLSVTVIAGRGSGSLEGFTRKDGKAASGAMVLLLPMDEVYRTRYIWKQQSDLDGSFELSNIPPGRYTLMAIEDGWDLEWQRGEVLARYLPLATPVVIPESGKSLVKLPEALVVQPR